MRVSWQFIGIILVLSAFAGVTLAEDEVENEEELNVGTVEPDLGASREGSRTDENTIENEELARKRQNAENFTFKTEVNRMMKLIINSLYRNKEIFLRELLSNASDAIDKIRLLSLTDKSVLDSNPELKIRISADRKKKILTISDSGIGMTKQELINNLGTIAKSGTAEFLSKMQESSNLQEMNDMIGQFGVGFYSAFLVADKVSVTSKHNDDKRYTWESDSSNFIIYENDGEGADERGTSILLHMKDEALDFLEQDTIKNLVKKYSQFISYPIYLWDSKTIEVDAEEEKSEETKDDKTEDEEDAKVEDVKEDEDQEEDKKPKKVSKTVWDWVLLNEAKPIWTMKPAEISDQEYNEFYKSLTKDYQDPLAKIHFIAEGEVSFKSLLYIPAVQPSDSFNRYGTKDDNIKLYVRRVFISDKFNDLMPNYLAFIQGIVDSDDLPLNISRENLQQHKLIKIIKKKLIRKVLDMIKKIPKEEYEKFWKEYSTNIKLGVIEDAQNRARLSKLLRFRTSKDKLASLADYVERMKPNQQHIYYIAGASVQEVKKSPFVERLLKKGYEVIYLIEAVDEYTLSSVPEFEGKKFQNVAKEGFKLEEDESDKEKKEELEKTFEPLIEFFNTKLKDFISKAQLSDRLTDSSCALVASTFGWTGNMERLALSNAHQKSDDPQKKYYLSQKKILEINPQHPIILDLLQKVEADKADPNNKETAMMLFRLATLRSGYMLREPSTFALHVENLLRKDLGIPLEEPQQEETSQAEETKTEDLDDESKSASDEIVMDEDSEKDNEHDEL